jgi:glycosyltransferase involved in cell wall biosynthesis
MTGKPLIFHIHATEIDRTGGFVNQVIYDIEKKGMEIADKVVAVSQFTKDIIIKHYGISPDKIEVVHNGIDYYLQKSGQRDQELIDNLNQLKNLGAKFNSKNRSIRAF